MEICNVDQCNKKENFLLIMDLYIFSELFRHRSNQRDAVSFKSKNY